MSAALDRLRAHIRADPQLELRLSQIDGVEAFAAAALDVAASLAIPLDAQALRDALRPDPLGLDRFDQAPFNSHDWPDRQWLPTAVTATAGGPAIDWTHFAGARLTEPFFELSARHARQRPFNRLVRHRTKLSEFVATAPDEAHAVPDGLIFHLSRCGSTLVAQMLAAANHHVISEAAPLDAVMRLIHQAQSPVEDQVALLRAMVGALGRRAAGERYIVKLDHWHALALPLFRLAFPDTPWVFLYRDPVEILVSHQRAPGVPGALHDAVSKGEDGTARELASICAAVLEHFDLGGGLLVNYDALPDAVARFIVPHFGLNIDADAMRAAARADVKHAGRAFSPDTLAKQQAASAALRKIAAEHLAEPYARLEALRLG